MKPHISINLSNLDIRIRQFIVFVETGDKHKLYNEFKLLKTILKGLID